MKIRIFCIGKIKAPFIELFEEYASRVRKKGIRLEIEEFETRGIQDEKKAFEKENEWLETRLKNDPCVILAMDRQGEMLSSEELALFLQSNRDLGKSITIIIGGSHGLSKTVLALANKKISISKMTFPHLLFRVVLMEQIYRALSILDHEPYHK